MSEVEIRGSKGGGGKGGGGGTQRAPVEAPDSLQSRAIARVTDLWCEGEIEGPASEGLTWVYLNETPAQNENGTYNFKGFTITTRLGTQSQNYISGSPGVENELAVGVEVTHASPVVRTVTNANVNAVRVTIGVPQLQQQNTTSGDLNGSSISIAIDVQSNGGGYVERLTKTITGKESSNYQKSFRISLAPDTGPWDIRVRRITPDSTSAALLNKSNWDSYAEIIEEKLRYPNSAYCFLTVDSEQFNAIPNRSYDLKLLRIRVPSNYEPLTRIYTGSWDGTFKIAWSDNPAWCYYDLVTNERYGLGAYISDEQISKWDLYAIAQYCDQLVHDGMGGMEPRFTCNLYLQTRQDAYKVLQDLASCFRAMIYWAGGVVTAVQDSPSDPVYLYTASNVETGRFTYAGSSQKQRTTVALVTWNDPSDFYRQKVEYVEDKDGIARYGINQKEIVAVGCTSRGQAHRLGRWLLYSEIYENETVTFRTGIEGAVARPGQIILVQDPDRAGARQGGRVNSATTNTVTIDQDITLEPGVNTLYVLLSNGNLESRAVSGLVGRTLTLAMPFSLAPVAEAVWMLSSSTVEPQPFRVIAAIEAGDGLYEVSALTYNPDKYAAVEDDLLLEQPTISTLRLTPGVPADMTVQEALYSVANDFKTLISVSWPAAEAATRYQLSYSRDNGNIIELPSTGVKNIDIRDAQPGLYKFWLVAISALGRVSGAITKEVEIFGKTALPSDVTSFYIQGTILTWSAVPDIDVKGYRIKFQPGTSRSWEDAVEIHTGVITQSPYDMTIVPSGENTLMIKAVDTSENESQNPAYIVVNLGDPDIANVVEIFDRQAAIWPGTLTGGTINGSNNLVADSETLMWNGNDMAAMWSEDSTKLMWAVSIYSQMTYEDQLMVSAALAGSRMTITRTVSGNPWSIQYRENGPSLMWNVDGSTPMWNDDANEMWDVPDYQAWPGEIIAKNTVYDFLITTGHGPVQGEVDEFAVIVDAPDIEEFLNDIAILAAGTRLPITKTFQVISNLQLTVQNDGGSAVTARYDDKDASLGPLVKCLSAAGAGVDGTLDARIKGY